MAEQAFGDGLGRVARLLASPERVDRAWPSVLAALVFAVCALALAAATILSPPPQLAPTPTLRAAG